MVPARRYSERGRDHTVERESVSYHGGRAGENEVRLERLSSQFRCFPGSPGEWYGARTRPETRPPRPDPVSLGAERSRVGLRDGENQGHGGHRTGQPELAYEVVSGPQASTASGVEPESNGCRRRSRRKEHTMLPVGVAIAKATLEAVARREGHAVRLGHIGTFAQTADGWAALRDAGTLSADSSARWHGRCVGRQGARTGRRWRWCWNRPGATRWRLRCEPGNSRAGRCIGPIQPGCGPGRAARGCARKPTNRMRCCWHALAPAPSPSCRSGSPLPAR